MNQSKILVTFYPDGTPQRITDAEDQTAMNWLSPHYRSGAVAGFDFRVARMTKNGTSLQATASNGVCLTVRRRVWSKKYTEVYSFYNATTKTVTLDRDFGAISYAPNHYFDKKPDMLVTRCNTHIFTGEDQTYLYSVKLCGKPPFLVIRVQQGSFSGYGLATDRALCSNASFDRGQIWLFPTKRELQPGQTAVFRLSYRFSDQRPEKAGFTAFSNRYSLLPGETIKITLRDTKPLSDPAVFCNGETMKTKLFSKKALCSFSPQLPGQYHFYIHANGKETHLDIQALPDFEVLLQKRAEFICRKQQYLLEPSDPRYGAYLIYDRERGDLVCESDFPDRNAARERLAMGVVVALAAQHSANRDFLESLRLYRAFLEREIVNTKTGEVKNGIADSGVRLYNFPWVSTFYYEYYRCTGEKSALFTAADVMIRYYKIGGETMESHVEIHRLLPELWKVDPKRAEAVQTGYLKHADSILNRRTRSESSEVSCANGMMSMMGIILLNAYLLTGNRKYLDPVEEIASIVENFYAFQPDYHCYGMAVRYWDLYWFGGSHLYGDTFPQWLSANTAEFWFFYDRVFSGNHHRHLIREILLGGCCVYDETGFGSCGYLYPDRVTEYSSDPTAVHPHRPDYCRKGRFYDDFANDQDWVLYYAENYLPGKKKKSD